MNLQSGTKTSGWSEQAIFEGRKKDVKNLMSGTRTGIKTNRRL